MSIVMRAFQALRLFGRLRSSKTRRRFLTDMGEEMILQVDDSFHSQESPSGKPWPELSPVTKMLRRGSTYHKLVNRGILRNSVNYQVKDNSLKIGFPGKLGQIAAVHNQGMTIKAKNASHLKFGRKGVGFFMVKKVKIPRRQFMPLKGQGLPRKFRKAATEVVRRHYG